MIVEVISSRYKVVTTVCEEKSNANGANVHFKVEKAITVVKVAVERRHLPSNCHVVGEKERAVVSGAADGIGLMPNGCRPQVERKSCFAAAPSRLAINAGEWLASRIAFVNILSVGPHYSFQILKLSLCADDRLCCSWVPDETPCFLSFHEMVARKLLLCRKGAMKKGAVAFIFDSALRCWE